MTMLCRTGRSFHPEAPEGKTGQEQDTGPRERRFHRMGKSWATSVSAEEVTDRWALLLTALDAAFLPNGPCPCLQQPLDAGGKPILPWRSFPSISGETKAEQSKSQKTRCARFAARKGLGFGSSISRSSRAERACITRSSCTRFPSSSAACALYPGAHGPTWPGRGLETRLSGSGSRPASTKPNGTDFP